MLGGMRLFTVVIIVTGFACGCSKPDHSFSIPDVTAAFTTNLTARTTNYVMFAALHVHGQLDGTGYISGSAWPTQALSGTVDWKDVHDYYEQSAVFSYSPGTVKSGKLRVECSLSR